MTADGKLTISVDVKNTGSVTGAEVLQLYISDSKSSQPRPVKELKGFKKVSLAPGETQQVDFTIDCSALSFYNEQTGEWTAEPGEFTKRAFLNGRIDLSEAESIMDLISSNSELAMKNSIKQLSVIEKCGIKVWRFRAKWLLLPISTI